MPSMVVEMAEMAATASRTAACVASTCTAMSSEEVVVSLARSLTSPATTAKPLPASPARAASMVALSASRRV